jgi:hypothetical protein
MRSLAACLFIAASGAAFASPLVLAPGASFGGRSAEELSVQWWQWVMSVPGENSPVKDPTGSQCGAGQNGDVWFLAGGQGRIRRTCEVPAGKAIFFPVAQKGDRSRTCEQARAGARLQNVEALGLRVEIDGVAVPSPKRYRVATQACFDVYGKVSPMLGKAEPHPSASDGYWLLLAPPPRGRHVIKFSAKYDNLVGGSLDQDIEYELKVQ